jgi:tripartite-type tricarboxylate transporter receptor subunit TctC
VKFRAVAIAVAVFIATVTNAEAWPDRPVRIIVPLTAGSATDIVARIVGQRLSEQLGQPFIVENKPGAGGTIGTAAVAQAIPDGYTLLIHSSSYTTTPIMYPHTRYNTQRDLAGVTKLAVLPQVLVVAPDHNINSVKELIELAKSRPGTLNYSTAGFGTATHLNAERFRIAANIDVQHVPFKGAEAVNEVLAGRIDYTFCPLIVCAEFIADKRLLALGLGGRKRSAALPDLPTTVELGVANSDYEFWVGLFLPAQTPRPIVEKLYAETEKALLQPAVRERFATLGADLQVMEPKAFDGAIAEEITLNAALVKAAGIAIEAP